MKQLITLLFAAAITITTPAVQAAEFTGTEFVVLLDGGVKLTDDIKFQDPYGNPLVFEMAGENSVIVKTGPGYRGHRVKPLKIPVPREPTGRKR